MKDLLQAIVFAGIFAVPFLTLYVENDFFFPFITGKNFAFRIIVEIAFASWALLAMYEPKYRPRFSWILAGFSSFLLVMLVANALGEYPLKSFWSNFERMDGFVTLVHVFMYLTVVGSMLQDRQTWSWFLHTSVAVALLVAVYGLMQSAGMVEGAHTRVDSRLGNAAYMAVYMLFHIFIVALLFVRSKTNLQRGLYAAIILIFVYTLLLTGTRGTFLGVAGGSVVTVGYIALFGGKYPQFRRYAAMGFIGLVMLAGSFFVVRDADFVQDSRALKRIADINLVEDLVTRGTIWEMALTGVAERPLLGWGQGNFNYVFNTEYDPYLWDKESWFDRVHNIVLDWLIAGGVFGLVTYLSIFAAALYYLFWQPLRRTEEEHAFNVLERGVLLGLLAGYFAHNLVVFDNIISYIFFAVILALIHSAVGKELPSVRDWKIDERLIVQFAMPLVVIVAGATIWFANAPGIAASGDIIDALRQPTAPDRLEQFDEALSRNSFATQEIVEQLAQNAIQVARTPNVPVEDAQAFITRAEEELQKLILQKPNDARLHVFFATFYRSIGDMENARTQAALARDLSPAKQAIIVEQGAIELALGEIEKAQGFFKTAFELAEENTQARVLYASTMVSLGDVESAKELLGDEYIDEYALNSYAVTVAEGAGDQEFLVDIFEARVAARPNNAQNRATLAFLYYEVGNIDQAVTVLQAASEALPEFAPTASCFITNLEAGNEPDEGC